MDNNINRITKNLIPYVVESTPNGERSYDLVSRLMEDRIVLLVGEVNESSATVLVMQLLYLDAKNNSPIKLYINSPGGVISDGLAIIDTMRNIKSPVHTIVFSEAASMGALILTAGEPGHRYALEHARIMIHQPLGGMRGKMSDMEIAMEQIKKAKKDVVEILTETTGKTAEQVEKDMEKDYWMYPKDAKKYGLIDNIISSKSKKK